MYLFIDYSVCVCVALAHIHISEKNLWELIIFLLPQNSGHLPLSITYVSSVYDTYHINLIY